MSNPLPCPDRVLLEAILRGDVSLSQQTQIAQHLEECEQCRMAVDLIEDLSDSDEITDLSGDEYAVERLPSEDTARRIS